MDSETNTNHRTNHVPDLPSLCRFIFNNSPLPVAMAVGAKHIVRYVNPAFCFLTGKSEYELIGNTFSEILPEDECLPVLDRVYCTGEAETHTEPEHSEIKTAYWSYAMWPVLGADERPMGVMIRVTETAMFRQQAIEMNQELLLTAVRQHELIEEAERLYAQLQGEMTARKLAEEALFRAGALQRAIFNSTNFSSIATDANGIIQIFNVGAERMLGYTAAEVMNKITPADISDPQEVIARAKELSLELGIPIRPGFEALVFKASRGIEDIYELTKVRKDGSRFPAIVSVTALRDAQEAIIGYLLIGTDNTARKLAEEALIRSEKLASVGRLAATITHEINNPLSSALNALFLVRTDPALPQSVKSHLTIAEQELGRVAHITKQTLGFFREVGNPTAVDLAEVLDSVLDIYGPRLRDKEITVLRSYRSKTGIRAVDGEMRQVASNILANSFDALSQGGKLHMRLFGPQAIRGARRMVRMTIADDGAGIAAENLKRIFEPFFTTKQSIGTGLGLWVTSELVKKHGGRMRLRSRLGKGTVVTIWLPMERRGQEQRTA
jgi:PAS domain S-box-containing protein